MNEFVQLSLLAMLDCQATKNLGPSLVAQTPSYSYHITHVVGEPTPAPCIAKLL